MGGSVNVFLRDHNGEFFKMTRWTNQLPYYFDFIGHVDDEREHLASYMKEWLVMRDDYNRNRHRQKFKRTYLGIIDDPFENEMTSWYFPSPRNIYNSEYGLIFVDCITKTILSYQDYTTIGELCCAGVSLSVSSGNQEDKQWHASLLKQVISKGCLNFRYYTGNTGKVADSGKVNSFNELLEMVTVPPGSRFRPGLTIFEIDNSPWNIVNGHKGDRKVGDLRCEIKEILKVKA